MPRFHIVLVEPQYSGNIGFVARAMKNFGITSLRLTSPHAPLDAEARDRAVHAQEILEGAREYPSLKEASEDLDYLVAFSSRTFPTDRTHLRVPLSLRQAACRIRSYEGSVGLVFGREDDGLRNEEIARSDVVVRIPTAPEYPSMNLSHAVAVALYEIHSAPYEYPPEPLASVQEKEILFSTFDEILREIRLPPHRLQATRNMYRRLIGKAGLSVFEYHRLMGVHSRTLRALRGGQAQSPKGWEEDKEA